MGRIVINILLWCALASPVAAEGLGAKVVEKTTVPDEAYEEAIVRGPSAASPAWRIRTWGPVGERDAESAPLRAIVIIDGQADVGAAAAMARQAEAVLADDAMLIITIAPADEAVAQSFRRRAWSAEESAEMTVYLRTTLAPQLRRRSDVGTVRLIGMGRGADVALSVFGEDPFAFDSIHAKAYRLGGETLAAIVSDLPTGKGDLRLKLELGWSQAGDSPDPTALAFLEGVKGRGHAVEWKLNESDEQFLRRSLLRP